MLKNIISGLLIIIATGSTICFAAQKDMRVTNMTKIFQNESDPEFAEIAQRFINKDIANLGELTTKERDLITIVVLTVNQQPEILQEYIKQALEDGVTPEEIKEAIYQTAPYAGIPKTLIAIKVSNQTFKEQNIQLPLKSQKTVNEKDRYEKGLSAQVEIFGDGIKNMKNSYPKTEQFIPQYLAEYCFGDFYTRQSLDLQTRELLTLCMLAALGDTESQIKGHITGNLNTGNSKEKMIAAIAQCLPYIGFPRTLNAIRYLNEAIPE